MKSPYPSSTEKVKEGGIDLIDLEEKKTEEKKEGQNYLFDLLDFSAVPGKPVTNTDDLLDFKENKTYTSKHNDDLVIDFPKTNFLIFFIFFPLDLKEQKQKCEIP